MKLSRHRVNIYITVLLIWFVCPFGLSKDALAVELIRLDPPYDKLWTTEPFNPGFSVLEPPAYYVYDSNTGGTIAQFPSLPVKGSVKIPVFLVDWSDFDPKIDESNHDNPLSIFPDYQKKTPEELSAYLNGLHGPADYFNEVSGGQLQITFDVMPWMISDQMTYLQDKEPTYYYFDTGTGTWQVKRVEYTEDVLRSTVADLNIDLTQYDADNNGILDGFVIVYEGGPGKLAGTNVAIVDAAAFVSGKIGMRKIADLVPTDDINYSIFASQQLLYARYNNIPEQNRAISGLTFTAVATWIHELGHLLLGYRDYYFSPTGLGMYALSANGAAFHPAAMEKWLFAHWIDAYQISDSGNYLLTNHHLKAGQTYAADRSYLYTILIEDDPNHFLTIENRYFLPESQGGSFFNADLTGDSPESGLVIFEVNKYLLGRDQIRRLLPDGLEDDVLYQWEGAFQPGDIFHYVSGNFHVTIDNISMPNEDVSLRVVINHPPDLTSPADISINEGGSILLIPAASDPDGDTLTYTTSNLPLGAGFNQTTGAVSWNPGYDDAGIYNITFTATDPWGLSDSATSTVTVTNVNRAPILDSIGSKSVYEGSNLTFTVSAIDPDGDNLIYSASNLPVGASFDASIQTFNWTPADLQANLFQTVRFTVSDGALSDDETISITVLDAPDLITSSLSTTATAVTRGSSFTLSNTAANQGTAPAGGFKIAFSLSTDANYGGTDDIAFSTSRLVTSLAAGANSSASTSLTVPSTTPLGSYYVCAKTDSDNTLTETDEANNSRCTTSTIQIALPDLVMTKISGPANATTGTGISLASTVKNQGISSAGSFYIGFYLSTDATITTADTRVGTQYFSSLAAGASISPTTTVAIPTTLAAGTYYIGAIADYSNARAETNETNNALTGNTVVVTLGADLVMTAVSGPTSAATGTSINFANTVKNQGVGSAGGFYVGLYLSTDPTITTADTRAGTRYLSSLAAGASNSATTTLTIPVTLSAGTYYIGAIADYSNTAKESNETNNALTGNTVVLTIGADLVMSSVSGPSSGTRGTSISISNTVTNQGAGNAASFYVGLYLSSDAVITTTDSRVGTRSVTSLAAGATSSATTSVTIPTTLAAGTYYIGAIADYSNTAKESNETNNARTGNTIVVQ